MLQKTIKANKGQFMNHAFSNQSKVTVMNHNVTNLLALLLLLIVTLFSHTVKANDKTDIDKILTMTTAPNGVVFELIGQENSTYLPTALTKIQAYKNQLKNKFPKIKVAVVSHGSEQFELTTNNATKEKKAHQLVKRITAADVPVHICEGHASWRQIKAKDFPSYITPSASGPAQIRQYQSQGYLLVIVD